MSRLQKVINNRNSPDYSKEYTASGRVSYISGGYFPDVSPNSVTAYKLWASVIGCPLTVSIGMNKCPWGALDVQIH